MYQLVTHTYTTILNNHNQFTTSERLEMSEEDQNLPYLYWTPKFHKSQYKQWFIASSLQQV